MPDYEQQARELAAQAQDADPDTESKLARLRQVTKEKDALEAERVKLRDELAPALEGPRYFIDAEGVKRFGYVLQTEEEIIDLDKLSGYVSEETVDAVSKRVPDREAFRKAVARGDIPVETAAKVVRYKPKAASVRFGTPYEGDE